jgi:hypothetical protein
MTAGEFAREWGGGRESSWGRGSSLGRDVGGGLVRRAQYNVTVSETDEGVDLLIESAMSGWGGSALGVAREQNQRKVTTSRLQAYLGSLPVAAPTDTPASSASPDPALALQRLRELRDRDLITEEEYAAKRAEVLSRL